MLLISYLQFMALSLQQLAKYKVLSSKKFPPDAETMSKFKSVLLAAAMMSLPLMASAQQNQLIVGPNTNMVSGTTWPDGDPLPAPAE